MGFINLISFSLDVWVINMILEFRVSSPQIAFVLLSDNLQLLRSPIFAHRTVVCRYTKSGFVAEFDKTKHDRDLLLCAAANIFFIVTRPLSKL